MIVESLDLPNDVEQPKNMIEKVLIKSSLLSDDVKSKLSRLRRTTTTANFLKAVKSNNVIKVEEIIADKKIKKKSNLFTSGEAIKYALEDQNHHLALILQENGYEVPYNLLIKSIEDNNENLATGLVKFNFLSEEFLEAYFWFLLSKNYESIADDLIMNYERLSCYKLTGKKSIESLLQDENLSKKALEQALVLKADLLAESIIIRNPNIITFYIINLGIEKECIRFIKVISTGKSLDSSKKMLKPLRDFIKSNLTDEEIKKIEHKLDIKHLINHYLSLCKYQIIRKILAWPESKKIPDIISLLISNNIEEIADEYIKKQHIKASSLDFFKAFDKNKYELCIGMLSAGVRGN